MVKLLVIADDFTGALDTGVQFSKSGIQTRVIVGVCLDTEADYQAEVLVLDAETRHLTKEKAYQRIYEIVSSAEQKKIPHIYKKTDSALRGNIGSELKATQDAAGIRQLPFLPAFPAMHRFTRKGIQYIGNIPVSRSVFGRDPFEPVKADSVKDIILSQVQTEVTVVSDKNIKKAGKQKTILVCDAESEEDLRKTAAQLKEAGQCHVMAGCAGFAALLPELLGLYGHAVECAALPSELLVICGSVNPITRRQLSYGEEHGFARICLLPGQKMNPGWWESEEGGQMLAKICRLLDEKRCCILDSNDPETQEYEEAPAGSPKDNRGPTMRYARQHGISAEELPARIALTLGMAARKILEKNQNVLLLVTGGDTLLGLMRQIGVKELRPVREIVPGCVLAKLRWQGRECSILTKSGGFGEKELLEQITGRLWGGTGE